MEEDSIWRGVIATQYGVQPNGDPRLVWGPYGTSPWKGIMNLFQDYKKGLRVEVGNGQGTKFWKDRWCGNQPLKREFPSVFLLLVDLCALVSDYREITHGAAVWQPIFRRLAYDY